jgi:hypothetical protein
VGVAHGQTVEDGAPREPPYRTLHFEGTEREFVRVEIAVKQTAMTGRWRVVMRACQHTQELTASLERIRIE